MPWVQIRWYLRDDHRVLFVKNRLMIDDVDLLIGKLERLWEYASQHAHKGWIKGATPAMLDGIVQMQGMGEALIESGLVEVYGHGCKVNEYYRPPALTGAQRMALYRGRGKHREVATNGVAPEPTPPPPPPAEQPKPKPKLGANDLRASFEKFWEAYPIKKGKDKAWKTWQTLKPSDEFLEVILQALSQQITWPEWVKENGQYIPYPSTWLNQKRWDDKPLAHAAVATQAMAEEARLERIRRERQAAKEAKANAVKDPKFTREAQPVEKPPEPPLELTDDDVPGFYEAFVLDEPK